jgi:hypothetical protein
MIRTNALGRRIQVRFLGLCVWLIAVFVLSGCVKSFHGGGLEARVFQAGQAFLVGTQAEEQGYGLYSYLLFNAPPTNENSKIFQYVIWACVQEIPDIEKLEARGNPRNSLNIVYIPVTTQVPDFSATTSSRETKKRWSQWILDHYNYDRARAILARIPKTSGRRGPYLASILSPTSSSSFVNAPKLVQDLSELPGDNPLVAFKWVRDFIRVSTPSRGEGGWNPPTLVKLTTSIRKTTAVSLADNNVSYTKDDLKRWISDTMPDRTIFYHGTGTYARMATLSRY